MTPLEKFEAKKGNSEALTRKDCINAHCQRCVGGDIDSGWMQRIKECNVPCELMEFRPYK